MKTKLIVVVLSFIALLVFGIVNIAFSQIEFKPADDKGPVVLIISGSSGPKLVLEFASRLSKLGYYAIAFNVNDFVSENKTTIESRLTEAINKVKLSPSALPGKVAVIGYSMGGGFALAHAANRDDSISAVIAYYPVTDLAFGFAFLKENEIETLPDRFKVPVFVFQGASDDYYNCCLANRIERISTVSKKKGADFNFVIYPDVGHGFNLVTGDGTFKYNKNYDEDSWKKTIELLKKYQPLPNKGP